MIKSYRLGIDEVRAFLPHRHPFLLIDRILEVSGADTSQPLSHGASKIGIRIVAQKNVSYGEVYFQGHFPERSVLPGVLIIEAMAQTMAFALYPFFAHELDSIRGKLECILVGLDEVKFRKPVVPGDVLHLEMKVTKCRSQFWGFDGVARVGDEKVAEAKLLAMFEKKS